MPRKLQVEYPGAIYHVMSRGDQREDIFLNDVDRHDFIKTLAEACQKTDWQIHAFCLMRNHYHLVLETPNPDLVSGMAWLQSTYTIRLNNPVTVRRGRLTVRGTGVAGWQGETTIISNAPNPTPPHPQRES
jgi:REP element-mobilizing transposase RayT